MERNVVNRAVTGEDFSEILDFDHVQTVDDGNLRFLK